MGLELALQHSWISSHLMQPSSNTEKIVLSCPCYGDGLKKNQNAPRPSEHPPVRGKNVKTFRLLELCVVRDMGRA